MVRSRLENGVLQNSSSGYTVGVDRSQEKSRASQGQTGRTSSNEISRTWTLPGKKLKNWQKAEQDCVNVAPIWMRGELRRKIGGFRAENT